MTCHATLSRPLAPTRPPKAISPEALRFLRLHLALVTSWRWHFLETQLRAFTDDGRSATIWRDELLDLVSAGLMRWGHGQQVVLTEQGRLACS